MQDIEALNIKQPTKWTKATDYISEQIDLIQKIEANGFTYITSDGVYFDTSKLENYGELIPGFNPDALEGGKRIDLGEKKSKTDFALWKFSPKDESRQMEWDSPWGVGFPGWHVECTAMGCKELGNTFDIHTGGMDHITVHHTNEIAQARGAYGHNHAKFWMHNEFLLDKTGKMSKSKGDFLRLKTIQEKGYHALDYRYFCLTTHYRKPLTFSFEALDAAKNARERLTNAVIDLKENTQLTSNDLSKERIILQSKFVQAISDDLNTSKALAVVHETLKSDINNQEKLSLLLDWEKVLGLSLHKAAREDVPVEVQELVNKRDEARNNKNWESADILRDAISDLGWEVSDTDQGSRVSPK
jgi:cysteinyl-tRNA synthetase